MSSSACDRQVGPYRIERELGRGGMGVVYLATRSDREYSKQVAIKLIDGHRGEELASRFRAERQILASLEHPNIARLLDGGTTADGDPYIAMEYVRDGVPIDDWCQRNQLTVGQKLEKFLAICSAVQHAHQHLIVHRDLKPGNILVTPEGDVKLLDFGIARPLAPLSRELAAASNSVARPMTPEYSSPEQQAGHPVGTTSDIYSLGVILFEMLIGVRPQLSLLTQPCHKTWGTPANVEASVYHGERLTLDKMPSAIPLDLASIILMALRVDPEQRYRSASELRLDIEHFLDGRPVVAHPSGVPYLAVKFALRHKLPIVAVALIIASLAGGMLTTKREAHLADGQRLVAEERAQEAERERRVAESKTAEADRLRALAEQQSKLAAEKSNELEEERLQAIEQRDETMKLATTLAVDLDAAIAPLAGSLPARRLLVMKAIEALERVYRTSPEDPKVLVELAGTYQSLGSIQRSRFASSLGDSEGALKSYKRSLELTQGADRILKAASSGAIAPEALAAAYAGAYFGLGDVDAINGKYAEALDSYLKSIPHAERAARANPPLPPELARARMVLPAYKKTGDMYRMLNRLDEAELYFSKASQAGEGLARAFPGNPLVANDRMVSDFSFGQLLEARDNPAGALAQYEKAARLARESLVANPNDSKVKRNLFVFLSRTGMMKHELEHYPEAQADYEKALAIAEERFESEKGNLQAVYDLADAHFNFSRNYRAAGHVEEARRQLAASGEMARRAAAIDPNAKQTKEILKRVEDDLARLK
ncbi:MAG TPA: serine/threonine-protein kinase [Bryobacteraceae bacterium]|jgi:tetratricopeptide (TPR) repeat protein